MCSTSQQQCTRFLSQFGHLDWYLDVVVCIHIPSGSKVGLAEGPRDILSGASMRTICLAMQCASRWNKSRWQVSWRLISLLSLHDSDSDQRSTDRKPKRHWGCVFEWVSSNNAKHNKYTLRQRKGRTPQPSIMSSYQAGGVSQWGGGD